MKDIDLFNKLKDIKIESDKEVAKPQGRARGIRPVDDFILEFVIDESDNELVVSIKNLINSSNIYKSQLYQAIGREEGYNMIYSLQKGVLSWARCEKWCDILEYKIDLSFTKINNK